MTAPAGALRFFPTWAIFPFCNRTSVLVSVPLVTVRTVAFLMSVGFALCLIGCCAPSAEAPPGGENFLRDNEGLIGPGELDPRARHFFLAQG